MKPYDTLPPAPPNYWVAPPTSYFYGQLLATKEPTAYGAYWPWSVRGYTPQQIRGAYGVTASGMTGRGQTVAVVDAYASPTMESDADTFSQVTHNQPFGPGQYQQYLPSTYTYTAANECDAPGWYGEETLDVESVHDMAPNADVHYVGAESCLDTDLAAADAEIVNQHLATIVTDSFGEPYDDAVIQPEWDLIFQAGAAEGIGFFFSSGDSGYEAPTVEDPDSNKLQVDYPTSSPWVTSVGGTSLAIGAQNTYEYETSWGTLLNPLSSDGTSWSLPFPPAYGPGATDWDYDGSSGGARQPGHRGAARHDLDPDAGGARCLGAGRSEHRHAGRRDDAAARRHHLRVRTQPHRRDERRLPDVRRDRGRCPAGRGARPRFCQPGDLPAVRNDHPLGAKQLFVVRDNYAYPYTARGSRLTYLRTLGVDGQRAAALPATAGYDDSTGVGSPDLYIQSFAGH